MAGEPMFTLGQGDCGAWNCQYATAISPERMNAVGRVKSPSTTRIPPTTSSTPPIHACDQTGMTTPGGSGGTPSSFIVPKVMKTAPVTMRTMLSTRPGQGGGAGSKIDMVYRGLVVGMHPSGGGHPARARCGDQGGARGGPSPAPESAAPP